MDADCSDNDLGVDEYAEWRARQFQLDAGRVSRCDAYPLIGVCDFMWCVSAWREGLQSGGF